MTPDGYRVGVLGATGAVGSTMLEVLAERGFPAAEVVPFASERSAGRRLELRRRASSSAGRSRARRSRASTWCSPRRAATVSAEWAPRLVDAGAVVVDNTSYWRMHDDVPLVVAEVNPDGARRSPRDRRQPELLGDADGRRAGADPPRRRASSGSSSPPTSRCPAPGGGRCRSFAAQAHALLHDAESPPAEVYPHRIAFNVLPQVETFKAGDDYTTEERKMMAETRKILGAGEDELRISATCVRVPVLYGESESVNVQTREPLSPEECRELLARAPGRGGRGRPRRRRLPAGERRRRPRRGAGRPHPPRSLARALPQPVGGRRQPSQGRGDERRPARRALARARPGPARPRRPRPPSSARGPASSTIRALAGRLRIRRGRSAPPRSSSARRSCRCAAGVSSPGSRARSAWRRSWSRAGSRSSCPGHGTAVAITLALCCSLARVAAAMSCGRGARAWTRGRPDAGARRGARRDRRAPRSPLLVASIPFIVNGRVGHPRGRARQRRHGLHLLIADWLNTRVGDMPASSTRAIRWARTRWSPGSARASGTGLVEAFAGITLAIPVLTALVAVEALRGAAAAFPGSLAAALVALPYLVAAYLAQEAFKEPIEALFVLRFALLLPDATTARRARCRWRDRRGRRLHLQLPGPVLARRRRGGLRRDRADRASSGAGPGAPRMLRGPSRLRRERRRGLAGDPLAAAVALACWSCSPRRTGPDDRLHATSAPSAARRSAAASATCATSSRRSRRWASGRRASSGSRPPTRAHPRRLLPRRAGRRRGAGPRPPALASAPRRRRCPAALAAAIVVYLGALAFGTVYTSAKALAIAAPLDHPDLPRRPARQRDRAGGARAGSLPALARAARGGHQRSPASSSCARRPVAPDATTPTSSPSCARSSRARRCCSSAATTSSPTSCAARGRSPRSATTTTPTT